MPFRGFPAEAFDFYEGLEADNSKAYWQEHKAVYERCVKQPLEALLAELAEEFGEGKLFRPNRDIRFSTDKSPYKTAAAARVGPHGYVQLSSQGLGAGLGMFHLEPDQLERYRAAVDGRPGAELARIVETAGRTGLELIAHDSLKTVPRGYAKDHPRADLLRRKGIALWQLWQPAAWMGTAKAKQRIVELYHRAGPLQAWLDAHVGEPTAPSAPGRRR